LGGKRYVFQEKLKNIFLEEALLTHQLPISVHLKKKMPLVTEAMNVLPTE